MAGVVWCFGAFSVGKDLSYEWWSRLEILATHSTSVWDIVEDRERSTVVSRVSHPAPSGGIKPDCEALNQQRFVCVSVFLEC